MQSKKKLKKIKQSNTQIIISKTVSYFVFQTSHYLN